MVGKKKARRPKRKRPLFTSSRLCPEYWASRKKVVARDKKCQWPNCKRRTRLEVHHIVEWSKEPKLRFDEKNQICLCKIHHRGIKGKEPFFIKMFRIIVDSKYK